MTQTEVRRRYLEAIEPDIVRVEEQSEKAPWLDWLVGLEKGFVYGLFHPLGLSGVRFDALCRIFNEMCYCWWDDGDLSFCVVDLSWANGYSVTEQFVVRGWYQDLRLEDVKEFALRHQAGVPGAVVAGWSAHSFGPAEFEKIWELRDEINMVGKVGHEGLDDYYDRRKKLEQRVREIFV